MLVKRIEQIHQKSRGTYGRPRIHAELATEGEHLGAKRVAPDTVCFHCPATTVRHWVAFTIFSQRLLQDRLAEREADDELLEPNSVQLR